MMDPDYASLFGVGRLGDKFKPTKSLAQPEKQTAMNGPRSYPRADLPVDTSASTWN